MVNISILIPTKNEIKNIHRCIDPILDWANEILIVDSNSTDGTIEYCQGKGLKVIQFDYKGGWPKKRQWALDTYPFKNEWVLLLDSDEILSEAVKQEIGAIIQNPPTDINGFWIRFEIFFLGRQLRYGSTALWKLSMFRIGKGKYELRLKEQDKSMADMEVHEHVIVEGNVARLQSPIRHENINDLSRYIIKHDEYSNWEAKLYFNQLESEIKPSLWGNQAQKRRWLKHRFLRTPLTEFLFFIYLYFFKLAILDGYPGFAYAMFRSYQIFTTKAKIHELELKQ